ncbi:MAG TPA: nitric oxide reductase transcription regulator, partial [Enterobacteriaceae bacterium]|nr:nitric oxide reductase transcription regulator [Enterobacteriaceae bacterium]
VVLARAARAGDEVVLDVQHFTFSTDAAPPVVQPAVVQPVLQNLREATDAFQRELITRVLAEKGHSWAACARALQTDVGNLHRLAKRLGLKSAI